MSKVRVGSLYVFNATGWDVIDRKSNTPENGAVVRVINPRGCPPPNAMGHAFVGERETGKFIGLVSTASLTLLSEVIANLKSQVKNMEGAQ